VLVMCSAAITTQCAVVDTVDGRFLQTNRSTEKARNEAILLNIVRASHNAPLNFVGISRVSGTTTATLTGGAPSFLAGPYPIPANTATTGTRDVTVNSTTLGGSANASNSYDLTVLDSKEFYTALLSPVDLPTVNFFIRQGYPPELLFWLFVDSVRESYGGNVYEYQNTPDLPVQDIPVFGQRSFRDILVLAVMTGLTVETKSVESSSETSKSSGGKSGSSSGSGSSGSKTTTEVFGQICFDKVLARRETKLLPPEVIQANTHNEGLSPKPTCYGTWNPKKSTTSNSGVQSDQLTFSVNSPTVGTVQYQILTRSTFGIYQFLGQILVKNQAENLKVLSNLTGEDPRILALKNTGLLGTCFAELTYDGARYCIPDKGAEQTKRIFSLLSQLIALKTQTQDLAITPVVRVTQ
jgi:hypothetical protein